ncbi:MAG: hypothetical protein CMI32_00350 [Opitutales bacterium]|nr:hypothetical protein [Opitutales bacterium]
MTEQESAESPDPQPQSGKLLILVRHAKSSWDAPQLDDFARPLNTRGFRDAPDMGKRLAAKYPKLDHFASSPAVRAWTTAEILADAWNFPHEKLQPEPTAYEASTATLIDLVRKFPSDATTAALAAHNPGITLTFNLLAGTHIANVPTCGVAILRFPVDSWPEVSEGEGVLVEYDFPKNSPGLGR